MPSQDGSLLVAVHVQTAGDTTPTEPDPPDAGTEPVDDCRLNVHAVPLCCSVMF